MHKWAATVTNCLRVARETVVPLFLSQLEVEELRVRCRVNQGALSPSPILRGVTIVHDALHLHGLKLIMSHIQFYPPLHRFGHTETRGQSHTFSGYLYFIYGYGVLPRRLARVRTPWAHQRPGTHGVLRADTKKTSLQEEYGNLGLGWGLPEEWRQRGQRGQDAFCRPTPR